MVIIIIIIIDLIRHTTTGAAGYSITDTIADILADDIIDAFPIPSLTVLPTPSPIPSPIQHHYGGPEGSFPSGNEWKCTCTAEVHGLEWQWVVLAGNMRKCSDLCGNKRINSETCGQVRLWADYPRNSRQRAETSRSMWKRAVIGGFRQKLGAALQACGNGQSKVIQAVDCGKEWPLADSIGIEQKQAD